MPLLPRAPIRPIIAATEGAPHGNYAAGIARQIATSVGAELVVLRVVAPGEAPPPMAAPWAGTGGVSAAVADRIRVEVLVGYPSVEIVRCAERVEACLIVLGRRPPADLGDAMLGPTADQVVRRSPIPCLLIPDGSWR
ncbi:MAG: universal stress protein, partial [Gemmatimonadales bacterium]